MSNITLKREANPMLMLRSFRILVDGVEVDKIENGETKTIDLQPGIAQLTVKIMNYESKPLKVSDDSSNEFLIKQNLVSTIMTTGMILFALIYFVTKYFIEQEQKVFLYLAIPFFLGQCYYSTIGRRDVIQLEDIKDLKK